jgi:hypothetical protein
LSKSLINVLEIHTMPQKEGKCQSIMAQNSLTM